MTTTHEVTCIGKSLNHTKQHHLTHLGGQTPTGRGWRVSVAEAIKGIVAGKWRFFVTLSGRPSFVMVAVDREGSRYLRLEDDQPGLERLLGLPVCADGHSTYPEQG